MNANLDSFPAFDLTPEGDWVVRDARGAVHYQSTEKKCLAWAAAANAETDPRQRVDDGAYPFAAGKVQS